MIDLTLLLPSIIQRFCEATDLKKGIPRLDKETLATVDVISNTFGDSQVIGTRLLSLPVPRILAWSVIAATLFGAVALEGVGFQGLWMLAQTDWFFNTKTNQ